VLHAPLLALGLILAAPSAPPDSLARDLEMLRGLSAANAWAPEESLATSSLSRLTPRTRQDSLVVAEALYDLADARNNLGKWDDDVAIDAARRSMEIRRRTLPPDDRRFANAESLIGTSLQCRRMMSASASPVDSAIVHYRRAIDIERRQSAPNDTALADYWYNVGTAESSLGHGRAALDALQHSLDFTRRVYGPDDPQIANVLSAVGDAWGSLYDMERDRDFQEQALRILDRSGTKYVALRSSVLSRIANANKDLGDLSRAFDAAQATVSVAEAAGDSNSIIISRFNLGVILKEFGDHEGARQVLGDLLPVAVSHYGPSNWTVGVLRQTLGASCAALGDTAEAMKLYRQSEADLTADPDPQGNIVALPVQYQAEILHRQKRDREALAMSERAIQLSEQAVHSDPGILPFTRYLRIQILESLRDTTALERARRELAALRDRHIAPGSTEPVMAYWLAHADRALGRADAAWAGALEADRMSRDLFRVSLATLPDDRALQLTREDAYILNQVLDMADERTPSRWETAWDRLVQTRGLVRAELRHRRLPPAYQSDTALVRLHGDWVAAKRRVARRMVRGSAASDSIAQTQLRTFQRAADQAEAAYALALRARGLDTSRVAVGLVDVRAAIGANRALVAFAELRGRDDVDRMIAFVARAGDTRIDRVELGRSDSLRALIAPWRERLGTSPGPSAGANGRAERSCRPYGAAVRARVWDRIAPLVKSASEVDIVPDGPLADLPWNALPTGTDGYLVEGAPLVVVLDAERDLLAPSHETSNGSMLAMGDPDFDLGRGQTAGRDTMVADVLRASPDPCAAGPPHFSSLPGTGVEATTVADVWRRNPGRSADVLSGADATEAAFKRLAPGCAIVHVATHGVVTGDRCTAAAKGTRGIGGVDPVGTKPKASAASTSHATQGAAARSPWMGRRVWLAFAGANHAHESGSDDDDGFLTADEVQTLDLAGTDWVVLSACHSGLAEELVTRGQARHAPRVRAGGCAQRDREPVGRRGQDDGRLDAHALRCPRRGRDARGGGAPDDVPARARRAPQVRTLDPSVLLGGLHRQRRVMLRPHSSTAARGVSSYRAITKRRVPTLPSCVTLSQ
jgi:tetratricopeptide (TPR) repeat protein